MRLCRTKFHHIFYLALFLSILFTGYFLSNILEFSSSNTVVYLNTSLFIDCILFGLHKTRCIKSFDQVYIPKDAIEQTFEVNSKYDDQKNLFSLLPNILKMHNLSESSFEPFKEFLFFEKYNVELRSKVLEISVDDGVPVSRQWRAEGHKYPIQIAQFGLSHFSKWIRLRNSGQKIFKLDLCQAAQKDEEDSPAAENSQEQFMSLQGNTTVFKTELRLSAASPAIVKRLLSSSGMVILRPEVWQGGFVPTLSSRLHITLPQLHLKGHNWAEGSALHVRVLLNEYGPIDLFYVCSSNHSWPDFQNTYFMFIKNCSQIHLVRNLLFDIMKKNSRIRYKSSIRRSHLERISLVGEGSIRGLWLSSELHQEKFMQAADWLLRHQDVQGGWPATVWRKVHAGVHLAPGWYSAMAQGHAISLLVRVFLNTQKKVYLNAARRALQLFHEPASSGGIVAHFLDNPQLVWYEEYPTKPALFVLNGFMYSLVGLRDFSLLPDSVAGVSDAQQLLEAGLVSLRTLLPLFDSGSGSFYDLRHVTFPLAGVRWQKKSLRHLEVPDGPNRARWDYHIVHTELLRYLASEPWDKNVSRPARRGVDSVLNAAATRFERYLHGYRAAHN